MTTPTRYGFWLRNLHWLIATLVIVALTLVELHELAPRGSALRSGMMYCHMQFGMAVLLLFLPRLIVRLSGKRPAVVPPAAVVAAACPAQAAHVVFYALMVVQPVLGVLMMQVGRPLRWPSSGIPLPDPGRAGQGPEPHARELPRHRAATSSCGWPSCTPWPRSGTTGAARTTRCAG